jgi:nitrite reductase/ring-hydroxylating ferredoxin subunit
MAIDLGPVERFKCGAFELRMIGNKEIGILMWGDNVRVVRNICPHAMAPVCKGALSPRLNAGSEVGSLTLDDDSLVLTCPWHHWEFDLGSGRAVRNPKYRLKYYRAWIHDGHLFADIAASQAGDNERTRT